MNTLLQAELDELESEREEKQDFQGFQVNDLEGANWCFRKLKALKERAEEKKLLALAEQQRIEKWLADENKKVEGDIAFFELVVTSYFLAERTKDPKFKLSTPYGKVGTRKTLEWNYEETAAIESLKQAGLISLIRSKEELNKTEIKATIKDKKLILTDDGQLVTMDGEIIEGVTVTKEESISVKVEI